MTKYCYKNIFIVYLLATVMSGCSAITTLDEYRPTDQAILLDKKEKVVILGRRDAGHYETDSDFIECVSGKINSIDINVVAEQDFINAIYPWFEPRTAPKGLPRLKRLMQEKVVRKEVERQNIRYLVWLDGSTETLGGGGSMSCAASPVGGGCFGFIQWDRFSTYDALIWDLKELTQKGRIRVDSEGTSYVVGAVAPIPIITPVKSDACSSLGNQLRDFFTVS